MLAAIKALRKDFPKAIAVAVPVAAVDTCRRLQREVDNIICLRTPTDFSAVGLWYEDFSQTTDDEVRSLLSYDTTATFPTGA